jgi:hypothetical protein
VTPLKWTVGSSELIVMNGFKALLRPGATAPVRLPGTASDEHFAAARVLPHGLNCDIGTQARPPPGRDPSLSFRH